MEKRAKEIAIGVATGLIVIGISGAATYVISEVHSLGNGVDALDDRLAAIEETNQEILARSDEIAVDIRALRAFTVAQGMRHVRSREEAIASFLDETSPTTGSEIVSHIPFGAVQHPGGLVVQYRGPAHLQTLLDAGFRLVPGVSEDQNLVEFTE